jgi:GNAT superfamily N-acetyltransferase
MSQVFGIRRAQPSQAAAVSDLALRSKGHWGYDEAFLEACRAELTYTEADCASGDVYVAETGGEIAGFHVLRSGGSEGELEALFVDPPWIGHGLGRQLLEHALDLARTRGVTQVRLEADPGAEGFYARHGATRIGEVPSGSVAGRVLPLMLFDLGDLAGSGIDPR